MRKTKEFKNPAEQMFYKQMTEAGWDVTKRGLPDFVCFKGNRLILVEIKPNSNHHLKLEQYRLMVALARHGIECYRWSPDGGFEPVSNGTLDISDQQKRRLTQGGHENAAQMVGPLLLYR